jgi:TDG/mug DNA glycosylase family protein
VSRARSPRALARLQQSLAPGARLALPLRPGEDAERLRGRLRGAGFDAVRRRGRTLYARRELTLPDYLGARLRLLVCGLNPSPYSAETGVPFGRPGNRFWPAALAAGLVEKDRDPFAALACGIGFTDLVKRPTPTAGELARDDYRRGLQRVRALAREWRPRAVCFVGLEGWRRVVDPRARPGWVAGGFEARAAYLMPSTSGRNAHASLAALVAHLREAASPR